MEMMHNNNIMCITYPIHPTHIMQEIDISITHSFKTEIRKIFRQTTFILNQILVVELTPAQKKRKLFMLGFYQPFKNQCLQKKWEISI